MEEKSGLIIFIKNPVLGRVKTRLAHDIGDAAALRIYQGLLERTRRTALSVKAERFIFYSDHVNEHDEWVGPEFSKFKQVDEDLGERMHHALSTVLQSCDKAVLIGSDCPGLSSEYIEKAFELLDQCDLVIGPSHDGGYNLLGVRRLHPELFERIPWSTDVVLSRTIALAESVSLNIELLPVLTDIDTIDDLKVYPEFQRLL